nr:uncharacterized protein CI109_001945 [Kwoniella shandongensis]KAA5529520.1 hypothetical protein CI109_001945 [Kwoniella shandongensis]
MRAGRRGARTVVGRGTRSAIRRDTGQGLSAIVNEVNAGKEVEVVNDLEIQIESEARDVSEIEIDKETRRSHRDDDKSRSSRRRRRSRSDSSSNTESSDSESASESDSEDERRRRKRKEKSRRREKEDREEKRKRKEKKRAKRDRKKRSTASSTAQWGQYGLISEQDFTKKDSEFRAWLVEERKINPETVSKDRTKKEFAIFVEDFNTATLPHDKYYDMARYELKMNMIRSGQTLPDEVGGYDPMADMKAHSSSLKSTTKEKETFLSKEQVAELRRIEAERTEIGKRRLMGMDVPRNMGVRTEEQ